MPGIGIIINPHSRGHRKDPTKAERLGFIVGNKGSCYTTKDLNHVEELAKEFKEHNIEILGISGGDGTNHATLTTFLKVYGETPLPKIAFLRGGTMNNLANCLNIKGAPEKILSNLILKYHEGISFEETSIDLMKVNDAYGFLFGMGLVSKFIEKYNRHEKGDPTPWYALKLVIQTSLSALFHTKTALKLGERIEAKITLDGKEIPFKNYTMILAGTMEELGFGFRPLDKVKNIPGQFQLVAGSTVPRKLLFTMPKGFFSRPLNSEDYIDLVGSHAVIELENPEIFTIDGDIPAPTNKIEIKMGPKLNIIIP